MVAKALNILERSALPLKLTPISIRELLYINETPCAIFGLENNLFKKIIGAGSFVNKETIKDLIQKGQHSLFIYEEHRADLVEMIFDSLNKVTRSLSVGNPLEKAKKQMSLMTVFMNILYEDPTNDTILQGQYQSAKNLAYFYPKLKST